MPINAQIQPLLDFMALAPQVNYDGVNASEVRQVFDATVFPGETVEVSNVQTISISLAGRTLDARLYTPLDAASQLPLTLFFHGGGWVVGTLDTHDAVARALANASSAAVLSLAYRLAPEHPFPSALDDCFAALLWAVENSRQLGVDGSRIAVAGDSAGGNLAAATAIRARDNGVDLRHQLLIYPVTNNDFSSASYKANGGGAYFLSTKAMQWFWDQYLGAAATAENGEASILRVKDLTNLAPATIITAEFDPLRDEGLAYADRLREAGVSVDAVVAAGMIHGFFNMFQMVSDAQLWIDHAGANLKTALS
jgi:acetyl esterase